MPKGIPNKRYIGEFKQMVVEIQISLVRPNLEVSYIPNDFVNRLEDIDKDQVANILHIEQSYQRAALKQSQTGIVKTHVGNEEANSGSGCDLHILEKHFHNDLTTPRTVIRMQITPERQFI
jgi:hypothetical protein